MRHLWAILLISTATLPFSLGMSSVGVAQSSEPQPRFSDDGPPPGGCTPIGVTVSGEIVFPMTCKDFIERHKAKDRASTAAEAETKPPEASKAPDAVEADKALTTGEASKAADALQADKASATGEATNRAPAKADVSGAPAAAEASTAPTAADPGKPDENDAKPAAAAKAAADAAAPPGTRQAAVAPATEDTVKSSAEPATTAALSKRTRTRNRVAGSPGCTRFRTYDAASATYRDFGGHRRSCP